MIHKDIFLTEEKDVWVWRNLQAVNKPKNVAFVQWVFLFWFWSASKKVCAPMKHSRIHSLSHTHSLVQWTQEASIAESQRTLEIVHVNIDQNRKVSCWSLQGLCSHEAFSYWTALDAIERERKERNRTAVSSLSLCSPSLLSSVKPSLALIHLLGWTAWRKGSPTSSGSDRNYPSCIWGHTCAP